MKRRILIDVDGVLADLVGALCGELRKHGHPRTEWDVTAYNFEDCLPLDEVALMREAMERPGFCASLPWYSGASVFATMLHDHGDVIAVTKPYPKGPTWAYERQHWLSDHISKVIHTGHKAYVSGDVLIEDCVANIVDWLKGNPQGRAILIDRPWNRRDLLPGRTDRAATWLQVLDFVDMEPA